MKRTVEPGSCYQPPGHQPSPARARTPRRRRRSSDGRANAVSTPRLRRLSLCRRATLSNARRGFFLVYINSFNEWHEGHRFEPMKNRGDLTGRNALSATGTQTMAGTESRESSASSPRCSTRFVPIEFPQ